MTFYQSGAHVVGGSDSGLVSTLDFDETERWRKAGVQFTETKVPVKTFREFWNEAGKVDFDFISIDCEGTDFDILQQIDLYKVGCKCLCIEHNGDEDLKSKYTNYCMDFGLVARLVNNENIIFTK
jgi:FkbM family methyltransferase